MIRLIAADVDETLIKEGTHQINPEYFEVIRALRRKGVMFAAASGRNAMSLFGLFAPVKDEISMITCSGAVYWRYGKPHVISAIDYEDVLSIEEEVRAFPGASMAVDTADRVMMKPGQDALYHFLTDGYGTDVTLIENGPFPADEAYVKLAIYHPDRIEELKEAFALRWERKLHLCLAGGVWLDIVKPGCDKGNALSCIQQDLGILPEETAAFGDNGNDLEMLSLAGESYAVAGAREEVKRAAKHVIGPWQQDSVLKEMKRILSES